MCVLCITGEKQRAKINDSTKRKAKKKKKTQVYKVEETIMVVKANGKSDNIFRLLENILQMEIGIIEIKFILLFMHRREEG